MAAPLIRFFHKIKRPAMWGFLILFLFACAEAALGRPGGGSSYSGGGGSSGGGSGGDGGDIGMIIYLIFRYPQIAIPVIAIIIIYRIVQNRRNPQGVVDSSGVPTQFRRNQVQSVSQQIRTFQQTEDSNFSRTLFLDFAQHLYAQFHFWRSKKEFNNLTPYIEKGLFASTFDRNINSPVDVSELVIGAVEVENVHVSSTHSVITVLFDANYTETRNGHANRFQVNERWTFRREKGVQSKGPEDMGTLHCPNCGAGLELSATGACTYCGTVVEAGKMHWELISIAVPVKNVAPANEFGSYAEERGTDYPTIFDPNLEFAYKDFLRRHSISNEQAYAEGLRDQLVTAIFKKIYEAWVERDWEKARPLMTDFLFMSQRYWMDAYKSEGLINKLDDLQVAKVQLVKMESDKYFDSITVRIYASVKDYLIQEKTGKVIGGRPNFVRKFSEYWTFIRSASVNKQPSEYSASNCPNCGAPVHMGQTGICQNCNTKVTSGNFDWVLTRITQDEAYIG